MSLRLHRHFSKYCKLGAISFSMALAACGGTGSDGDLGAADVQAMQFAANASRANSETLIQASASTFWLTEGPENQNLIIDNASDWALLWSQIQSALPSDMAGGGTITKAQPSVNFQDQIIVGITRLQPDGCSSASIKEIETLPDSTQIRVQTIQAEEGAFCTQQISHTLHLVRTGKPKGQISFAEYLK